MGQKSKCISTMRQVIEIDGNYSSALNFLGYLYAEAGEKLDEAENLINRALKIKPTDGYYLDSLGWVYYQKGEYDKALKTLLEANALVPGEGVILEHIGDVYRALGNLNQASQYYGQAIKGKIDPRDEKRIKSKYEKYSAGKT